MASIAPDAKAGALVAPKLSGSGASKLANLTSLRFFAAMWVVLLHFAPGHVKNWPSPVREFVGHGQNGVTLFFVLSGFILGYVYLPAVAEGRLDKVGFWRARFARVYPLYLFSLLIAVPFLVGTIAAATIVRVVPLQVFLLQSWDPKLLYAGQWNTPSWSLSTEAFFYLMFPWYGWLVAKLDRRGVAILAVSMLILAGAIRGVYWMLDPDKLAGHYAEVTTHFWAGFQFFNPIPRSLEFMFGLCLVRLTLRSDIRQPWRPTRVSGWTVTGVVLTGLAIFGFPHTTANQVLVYPLCVAFFGLLIVALCCCESEGFNRWFGSPWMLLLGEASYGIYMLQRPVAGWIDRMFAPFNRGPLEPQFVPGGIGFPGDLKVFWFFLVVLVGFSIVTLKLIELPARRLLRPKSVVS